MPHDHHHHPNQNLAVAFFLNLAFTILAVNGYAAWKLSSGKTMNERVASWRLLEDVLGWAAVLVVAVALLFKDIHYLGPALSLAITLYILYNVVRRLRQTLHLFLQDVPEGITLRDIEQELLAVPHLDSLHHTHLWPLEGEHHVFTTHAVLKGIRNFGQIMEAKRQMKAILRKFPFSHYTIETELDEENCELAE